MLDDLDNDPITLQSEDVKLALNKKCNGINTVNPLKSPLGAHLSFTFLDEGLFEGGLCEGGGAYEIIVGIKKTLLKDLVYFSKNKFN